MSVLYIAENGATVGINGGSISILHKNGEKDIVPKQTITGISIFGKNQFTTPMLEHCMKEGIQVGFFSMSGNYYGSLIPMQSVNSIRLKKQLILTECDEFCLDFAKKIIEAKIHNQKTVLRRHMSKDQDHRTAFIELNSAKKHIGTCNEIVKLMGYEGIASKDYFKTWTQIIPDEYRFCKRNRRPAKDPINSMLNIGYSLIHKEIHGQLQNLGLCAYAGFMHKDALGHAALASDLMEEWRPVIVDGTVLTLIQSGSILPEDFYIEEEACKMKKEAMKKLIAAIEKKMFIEMKYLDYISKPVSFRKGVLHQCECLVEAIENRDLSCYHPIKIR